MFTDAARPRPSAAASSWGDGLLPGRQVALVGSVGLGEFENSVFDGTFEGRASVDLVVLLCAPGELFPTFRKDVERPLEIPRRQVDRGVELNARIEW